MLNIKRIRIVKTIFLFDINIKLSAVEINFLS